MGSLTSPGLIKAANEALITIKPELNAIKLFSYDCSDAVSDYGLTVKVPMISGGTATTFSTQNNYESSTGTITYGTVQLNQQPKATFELNGKDVLEAPNAPYWNRCAEGAADSVSKNISATIGGLFTTTACSGGKVVMATVTKANLAKCRKECAGRIANTVLALSPDYYADALALFDSNVFGNADPIQQGYIGKLYGFKAVVQMNDLPSGVLGVIIPDNAIAIASRAVGVADESVYSEFGTVTDENGFTLTVMRHGSAINGKGFINVTTLFGATLVNGANCKYIAAS